LRQVSPPAVSERFSNRILILCRGPCAGRSRDAARHVILECFGLLLAQQEGAGIEHVRRGERLARDDGAENQQADDQRGCQTRLKVTLLDGASVTPTPQPKAQRRSAIRSGGS
jgi:hypothetical protein